MCGFVGQAPSRSYAVSSLVNHLEAYNIEHNTRVKRTCVIAGIFFHAVRCNQLLHGNFNPTTTVGYGAKGGASRPRSLQASMKLYEGLPMGDTKRGTEAYLLLANLLVMSII